MTQSQERPQQWLEADIISESRKIADLIAMVDSEEELTQDIIEGYIEGETETLELIDQLMDKRSEALIFIEGIKTQIEALQSRLSRYQMKQDKITGVIKQSLFITGLDKVTRPCYTLSRSKSQPDIEITEESKLPSKYFITPEPVISKKDLNADAKLLYKEKQANKRIEQINSELSQLLKAIEKAEDKSIEKEKRKVFNKLNKEKTKLITWLEETNLPDEIEGIKVIEREDKIMIRVK